MNMNEYVICKNKERLKESLAKRIVLQDYPKKSCF